MTYLISTQTYEEFKIIRAGLLKAGKIDTPKQAVFVNMNPQVRQQGLRGRRGHTSEQLIGHFTNKEIFYLTMPQDVSKAMYFAKNVMNMADGRTSATPNILHATKEIRACAEQALRRMEKKYDANI